MHILSRNLRSNSGNYPQAEAQGCSWSGGLRCCAALLDYHEVVIVNLLHFIGVHCLNANVIVNH